MKKKWKCKTVAKSDAWTREWIQNMKCNMKGARLFGKFICKAVISMGIKNPTYFLVALLQIEFCDEQTSQSPQYLEVAQLVEYLTGYSFRRPWFKSQLVYFYISPIPLYVMQWNWQVNSYQGNKSEYVNPQGPKSFKGEEFDSQTSVNTGARELCSGGKVLD